MTRRDKAAPCESAKIPPRPARKEPVSSIDAKKKELIGDFKNDGRELRPQGDPARVWTHGFLIPKLGRANPHGIFDIGRNTGWASVGVDHETAASAVESTRRWW